ncbi:MAG: NAD-dependent epimerase/dehydratase family protein, partial [Candidatus Limnocylindria bacterium]
AGLTGGAVVRDLARRGHDVIGVVRRGEQRGRLGGMETAVADCADPEAMAALLAGCDGLVHVAGIALGSALASVRGLRRLSTVVVVSSAGIYSAHQPSAALYREGEEALRAARPDLVLVRPTMIYGSERDRNVHHVIRFARRYGFLPIVGRGAGRLQPIHYADLAAAIGALVDAEVGEPLDAGGAAPITTRDAARAIFAALGRPARLVAVPAAPAWLLARAVDALRGTRWAERVRRAKEDRSVDNARLVQLTGVRPRDFETGVRDQVRESGGR